MLRVTYRTSGQSDIHTVSVFVSEVYKFTGSFLPDSLDVLSVEAEGIALNYILSQFKNIPSTYYGKRMTWFGDTAKFIYHHLDIKDEQ